MLGGVVFLKSKPWCSVPPSLPLRSEWLRWSLRRYVFFCNMAVLVGAFDIQVMVLFVVVPMVAFGLDSTGNRPIFAASEFDPLSILLLKSNVSLFSIVSVYHGPDSAPPFAAVPSFLSDRYSIRFRIPSASSSAQQTKNRRRTTTTNLDCFYLFTLLGGPPQRPPIGRCFSRHGQSDSRTFYLP